MPTPEQLQVLYNVSDTTLYHEAVTFIRCLVNEKDCRPLPASQVTGLLNIANASSYTELTRFIKHQRERDWPDSKKDIRMFYAELDSYLTTLKNKRVRELFPLVHAERTAKEASQEVDELMALLAHDFIQHLVMENALLATERTAGRGKRR